ncbi:MAG TPA: peptidylprolyl isomerase [Roseiflexaceae bacterium]|nr:peptidylprolyl isomerase [Roseiflexaceae bacterium]
MTQPPRQRKAAPPPPEKSSLPAIISAGVVVLVLVALLVVLLTNQPGSQPTAAQPTADPLAPVPTAAVGQPSPVATGPKKTYSAAPPMTIDATKSYTATITTPRGDIVIKLRPDLAPQTVNSFIFLAREGFFDGLTWHRVIPGFVAQGGDPEGTGGGGPGYNVPAEFTDKVLFDRPGLLAMARRGDDINSNGSQFFITLAPTESLNNQYTLFGEVIEGMDVVNGIPERDPDAASTPGEQMLKVTIQE